MSTNFKHSLCAPHHFLSTKVRFIHTSTVTRSVSAKPEVYKGQPTGTEEPIISSSHRLGYNIVFHSLRTDGHHFYDIFMTPMITRTCLRTILTQFEDIGAAARRGLYRMAVKSPVELPPARLVIQQQAPMPCRHARGR